MLRDTPAQAPSTLDLNTIQLRLEREQIGVFPKTSRLVQTQELRECILGFLLQLVSSAWSATSNGNSHCLFLIRYLRRHCSVDFS